MDTVEHVEDSSLNIQNEFFNNARKNHTRITVFLTNGQRISGLIRSFDKFTVILETRNGDQMVFKHAVTTVAASRPGEEEFRGPRPNRPPMGERGDHRPGGPPRPPRTGPPGAPMQGRSAGAPGPDGPRHDRDQRARGGAAPQGKSFGNFLDLSSLQKAKGEAGPSPVEATPAASKAAEPEPSPEPRREEPPAAPETPTTT